MTTETQTGLAVRGIRKEFRLAGETLTILAGVDLEIAPGHAVSLMGPSGTGKSTLLNIIGTLEPPTAGSVAIHGQDPFALPADDLARFRNEQIGFIFQEHHLLPQCSVLENVAIPSLAYPRDDRTERARALLDRVGLAARIDHRPAELSGGERQRVAIARALINEPQVVLADEPTGNLDQKTADSIADLLGELPGTDNVSLLVVTHSRTLAERFETRLQLDGGHLKPLGRE